VTLFTLHVYFVSLHSAAVCLELRQFFTSVSLLASVQITYGSNCHWFVTTNVRKVAQCCVPWSVPLWILIVNKLMNNDYTAYVKQLNDDRRQCVRQLRMETNGHRKFGPSPRLSEQTL